MTDNFPLITLLDEPAPAGEMVCESDHDGAMLKQGWTAVE
jgi:hypothetical protein